MVPVQVVPSYLAGVSPGVQHLPELPSVTDPTGEHGTIGTITSYTSVILLSHLNMKTDKGKVNE